MAANRCGKSWGTTLVLGLVMLTSATALQGQRRRRPPVPPPPPPPAERSARAPISVDLALLGGHARGGSEGLTAGGRIGVSLPLAYAGMLRLRADVDALGSGGERGDRNRCLPSDPRSLPDPRSFRDPRCGGGEGGGGTTIFAGIGPELALPGRISPYASATLGFASGPGSGAASGDRRGASDLTLAAQLAGGARFLLSTGRMPISLDLGARLHLNDLEGKEGVDDRGGLDRLAPFGGDRFAPVGELGPGPAADVMSLQLGVSIGLPRGGGRARPDGRGRGRRR